jgi:hypothetical protein
MTAMLRVRTALPSVLLLGMGLLAGCSGTTGTTAAASSSSASGAGSPSTAGTGSAAADETDAGAVPSGAERSGTPTTVDCPGKATPVDLPASFLAPLPKGTVVVAVQKRSGDRTVVTGVAPGAEPGILKEMQDAYLAAGFTLTHGETEARDAESNFNNDSVTGRWGIRELAECSPTATRVDVVIGPAIP